MKQSKANELVKNLLNTEQNLDIAVLSTRETCPEPYFDHHACDFCSHGLPGDTYDVQFITREDAKNKSFDLQEAQCCLDCLLYFCNSTLDQFQYHVDEEDEKPTF